eukprot:1141987-Rhodomonas_salina.1
MARSRVPSTCLRHPSPDSPTDLLCNAPDADMRDAACRISMAATGHASAAVPLFAERQWPPSSGYTLSCWVYVNSFGQGTLQLVSLQAKSKRSNEKHTIALMVNRIRQGCISLQTSATDVLDFPTFTLTPGEWWHVAVVHAFHSLQPSVASLLVNGRLRSQGQLRSGVSRVAMLSGMITVVPSELSVLVGTGEQAEVKSGMEYFIKGVFLVEDPLTSEDLQSVYRAGLSYQGLHQGDFAETDDPESVVTALRYASVGCKEEDSDVHLVNVRPLRINVEKVKLPKPNPSPTLPADHLHPSPKG